MLFLTLKCNGQQPTSLGGGNIGNTTGEMWLITGLFSAINISSTTFNVIKLKHPERPDKYKSNAIFSIISGSFQVAIGAACVTSKDKNDYIPAAINLGLGVSTIVTSIMRLARKSPPKETTLTYNFYYLPPIGCNTSTFGLRIAKQLN